MVETFNVLSIDWDYFIDASMSKRMELFPDGGNENLSPMLSDIIWSTKYGSNPELSAIDIDGKELPIMVSALERASGTIGVIVDSHRHLYDMIKRFNLNRLPLNVVNIDFHHDCYGYADKETVDCGNWALKAFEPGADCLTDDPANSTFTWVSRADSDTDDYDDSNYPWANRVVGLDKAPSLGEHWDIIFLCRSGVWSPPHLDVEFAHLAETVENVCADLVWQDNITSSRFDESMEEAAKQHREAIEQLMGMYQQGKEHNNE